MKKFLIFAVLVMLIASCCNNDCIGQIPPIPAYVDASCNAKMPDVLSMITVSDNCELSSVTQLPIVGSDITPPLIGTVVATDASGNISRVDFQVYALDTISPSIIWVGPSVASLQEGFDEAERAYSKFLTWVKKDTMFYIKPFEAYIDPTDGEIMAWYAPINYSLFDGSEVAWYNTVTFR